MPSLSVAWNWNWTRSCDCCLSVVVIDQLSKVGLTRSKPFLLSQSLGLFVVPSRFFVVTVGRWPIAVGRCPLLLVTPFDSKYDDPSS